MNFLIYLIFLKHFVQSQNVNEDEKIHCKAGWQLKERNSIQRTNEAVYFQTVCNETNINNIICRCKQFREDPWFNHRDQHSIYVKRGCPIEKPLKKN